jgi:hypothetical protein
MIRCPLHLQIKASVLARIGERVPHCSSRGRCARERWRTSTSSTRAGGRRRRRRGASLPWDKVGSSIASTTGRRGDRGGAALPGARGAHAGPRDVVAGARPRRLLPRGDPAEEAARGRCRRCGEPRPRGRARTSGPRRRRERRRTAPGGTAQHHTSFPSPGIHVPWRVDVAQLCTATRASFGGHISVCRRSPWPQSRCARQ